MELARTDIVRNQIYPRFSVTSLVPVLVAAAGAAGQWGIPGPIWLMLPLAALGAGAGPLVDFGQTRSRLPIAGLVIRFLSISNL